MMITFESAASWTYDLQYSGRFASLIIPSVLCQNTNFYFKAIKRWMSSFMKVVDVQIIVSNFFSVELVYEKAI